jgi:hypothetical protein
MQNEINFWKEKSIKSPIGVIYKKILEFLITDCNSVEDMVDANVFFQNSNWW